MRFFYISWLAVLLMPSICIGAAEFIYQYIDENGIRRFSDSPPPTEQLTQVSRGVATPKPRQHIIITGSKKGDRMFLTIANQLHGPVEVELSFKSFINLTSTPPLPRRFVVAARSELAAVELRVIDSNRPSPYRYKYRYSLGSPGAQHMPLSDYRLPFKKGQAYKVTQAFNGAASHNADSSRYAVDFSMPVGTTVVCSRGGKVVMERDDYVWGGTDKDYYRKRINGIRILHDDGTMAFYGHLRRGSSNVRAGDIVVAGQTIAESGNTGYSSGPHLHFVIQKNRDMRWASLPFKFKGPEGTAIIPAKGKLLRSE